MPRRTASHSMSALCILSAGFLSGWAASGSSMPRLKAGGGDRWGDAIVAAGSVSADYNSVLKVQVTQEALYYLDYRAGKLRASMPNQVVTGTTGKGVVGQRKVLGDFTERDLAADFKIDPDNGPTPHFVMTPLSMGGINGLAAGLSPLCVIETTTNQVAVYEVRQVTVGSSSKVSLDLVELRSMSKPQANLGAAR